MSALVEAAALDPAIFVDRFCMLKRAEGGAPVPFKLWPFQQDAIREFDRERFTLVLKARQLGLSWLADAFALWMCTFNTGITVLIFSVGQREAKEELSRIKYMHRNLPKEVQRTAARPESQDKIEFVDMDSRILSLPSTEDGGTGYTAQLAIVQEVAKIEVIDSMLTALMPTLGSHGKFIGVSTAKGYGNTFADLWRGNPDRKIPSAEIKLSEAYIPDPAKDSIYFPMFFPSSCHPDRDELWHQRTMRASKSIREFRQEYPQTPDEAFQLAGEAPFAEHFSRATHHVSYRYDRPQDGRADLRQIWRGVDFGLHVMPCYWAEVQGSRMIVFHEEYLQNCTTEQLADRILLVDRELGITTMNARTGVDPAGANRAQQTAITDVQILQRKGVPVAMDRRGKLARVKPADRVGLLQFLLSERKLLVDCEACPYLARAFEYATWDQVGRTGELKETYRHDEFSHPLDAIGYLAINVFPPQGPVAAINTVPPMLGAFVG